MFTGLIAARGTIVKRTSKGPGARLRLEARLAGEPVALGESIAVDGCCLSVAAITDGGFEVDASDETLAKTTLRNLELPWTVNLERAIRAGDRFGGHLVSGHVDGVGELTRRAAVGDAVVLTFSVPKGLERFLAEKGSIAVNGVSLTVNRVRSTFFDVTVIPVTLAATNLARLSPGDRVNLEVDLIARYLARLLEVGSARSDEVCPGL